jgi:hypothetical protein
MTAEDPEAPRVIVSKCKHPKAERELIRREFPTFFALGAPAKITFRCRACGRIWTVTGGLRTELCGGRPEAWQLA